MEISLGKKFYEHVKIKTTESLKDSWCDTYGIEKNDPNVWLMPFESVSETKLLELQWKILHSIYPSGTLLKKMKIREDENCVFCGMTDTLIHFFIECAISNQVWEEAERIITCFLGKQFKFTDKNKLIGNLEAEGVYSRQQRKYINKINLICKFSISKFKYVKEGNIKISFKRQLSFRDID